MKNKAFDLLLGNPPRIINREARKTERIEAFKTKEQQRPKRPTAARLLERAGSDAPPLPHAWIFYMVSAQCSKRLTGQSQIGPVN
jgi:hypothetical protein